ncbi:hypothetical protein Golob_025381 [Gossypium lobatum]|uniref:Uncharacterized protein n=1 Tax=Gossypium lobatum TaxID=34289 RepID=A0A7J8NFR9_9ROSI|nr:hypothetical protein [Gossypium lobatum]
MVARNSIGEVLVSCVTLEKEIASFFAIEARACTQGTGVEKNEIEEMKVVASLQILTGVF